MENCIWYSGELPCTARERGTSRMSSGESVSDIREMMGRKLGQSLGEQKEAKMSEHWAWAKGSDRLDPRQNSCADEFRSCQEK